MHLSHSLPHVPTTEKKNEKHVDYVEDVTKYSSVRAANPEDNFSPFWANVDKCVPCVVGVNIWSTKVDQFLTWKPAVYGLE